MHPAQFEPSEEYQKISDLYTRIDDFLALPDIRLSRISKEQSHWSSAKHIFHISRVNSSTWKGIDRILKKEPPAVPDGELNRMGKILFRVGRIKRGSIQAPDFVVPAEEMTVDDARVYAAKSAAGFRAAHGSIESIPLSTYRIAHPLMGPMNAHEWLSFIRIHSMHHLKIIDDILGTHQASH